MRIPQFSLRPRTGIGVDVGSHHVKAAVVDRTRSGVILRQLMSHPLPEGLIVEGKILIPDQISDVLRGMVNLLPTEKTALVTGAGARGVFVRPTVLPRTTKAKALAQIPLDKTLDIPMSSSENPQFDLYITDPDRAGSDTMVGIVVGARKDELADRQNMFHEAMIPLSIVDVDSIALFNVFRMAYPERANDRIILAHIGYDYALIVIVEKGRPVVFRNPLSGTRRLLEEIESANPMDGDHEDILRSPDVSTLFGDQIRRWADDCATNLRRSADLVLSEDDTLGDVFLSGGAALIPDVADILSEQLRAPVHVFNPLQRIETHPSITPADVEIGPLYTLAVSFALRGVR